MHNQLVWFRTDLRVHDNPALLHALSSGPSVAVYIATPRQWVLHDDAAIKLDFWRRNLAELARSLAGLNVDLLFFQVPDYQEVPALLDQLLGDLSIAGVHYNAEYPLNEQRRDNSVNTLCETRGVTVTSYHSEILAPPGSLLNQSGSPFKVFTPFAKNLRSKLADNAAVLAQPPAPPTNSQRPDISSLSSRRELADVEWPTPAEAWSTLWPAGEKVAQSRLTSFAARRISAYKNARDRPAQAGTSSLSPYLASGVISIGDCWRTTQRLPANDGVQCWQNELMWREFYRHIVYHFPRVCTHRPFKQKTNAVPWQHDRQSFEKWCKGETGFPLVDAGMRQLLSKGWMHNRLRMVTAMFLSKHLLIDWRWGEKWFMQNLIDGDLASNNGGWQWSASTGVDAVPYFRIFSPTRQSQRFDAAGDYIRTYVPELKGLKDKQLHDPGSSRPDNYPAPMIDHSFARQRALQAFSVNA